MTMSVRGVCAAAVIGRGMEVNAAGQKAQYPKYPSETPATFRRRRRGWITSGAR